MKLSNFVKDSQKKEQDKTNQYEIGSLSKPLLNKLKKINFKKSIAGAQDIYFDYYTLKWVMRTKETDYLMSDVIVLEFGVHIDGVYKSSSYKFKKDENGAYHLIKRDSSKTLATLDAEVLKVIDSTVGLVLSEDRDLDATKKGDISHILDNYSFYDLELNEIDFLAFVKASSEILDIKTDAKGKDFSAKLIRGYSTYINGMTNKITELPPYFVTDMAFEDLGVYTVKNEYTLDSNNKLVSNHMAFKKPTPGGLRNVYYANGKYVLNDKTYDSYEDMLKEN